MKKRRVNCGILLKELELGMQMMVRMTAEKWVMQIGGVSGDDDSSAERGQQHKI